MHISIPAAATADVTIIYQALAMWERQASVPSAAVPCFPKTTQLSPDPHLKQWGWERSKRLLEVTELEKWESPDLKCRQLNHKAWVLSHYQILLRSSLFKWHPTGFGFLKASMATVAKAQWDTSLDLVQEKENNYFDRRTSGLGRTKDLEFRRKKRIPGSVLCRFTQKAIYQTSLHTS